ncbi:dihydrolipoyl dehydrogenase [Mycolicibacterium komossense]|uniref:Dihydrolipoyl dehydrogenase n=1 Tax=Mycolicibacterium komossense TaxID=1779 RepID=A0ABT3CJ75_9MYCO|nr:dihydrolipoyl dehydrogenase [Mycolicibacterium komossense]MCV7229492.1 dihydrolipoyl dehydrogenase [Mycolicibacterium komossense]
MSAAAEAPQHFDVVVVGAGPGGYVAAIRAAQLGKRVAIVEERYWGGVCLNVGCIPSKALLRNAELADIWRRQADHFGIRGQSHFDYARAHERSREVADGRAEGIHYLMRKNKITEISGRARFTSASTLEVTAPDRSASIIGFTDAIVATGSRPRLPEGVTTSANVVTYQEMILDPTMPASLVIVGGGPIGMEFAYIAANFGAAVTILEYCDRVLPLEDADVSKEISRAYQRLGVTVHTDARVDKADDQGEHVAVTWTTGGTSHTVEAARVLVATGFAPNSTDLGLEAAEVDTDSRGAIAIDERMRTTNSHVYAIGDATMKLQLAHVAEAMGVIAAETIAGTTTMPIGDYRMVPRATFSRPQVASFGLTEEQARAEHETVRVSRFPFTANGKAHGLGEPVGFVKLLADEHGTLLGGHLIGPDVAELLPELTLAQKWELGSFELSRNIHVHPTLGEALQEAIHGLEGHLINF